MVRHSLISRYPRLVPLLPRYLGPKDPRDEVKDERDECGPLRSIPIPSVIHLIRVLGPVQLLPQRMLRKRRE